MIGSILARGWWARAICVAAGVWACAGHAIAQDGIPPLLSREPLNARGFASPLAVNVSLYRDTLTAGDKALYNEIFGHFADAVFEATEGQHFVEKITVFQNGQPVVDTPPVITISGDTPVNLEVGDVYLEQGATAFDTPDGDLTSSVITFGSVNTAIADTYFVAYIVNDSAGQQTIEFRIVNVIGKDPVITIFGENPLTVPEDTDYPYVEPLTSVTDVSDGNISSSISFDSNVEMSEPGTYFVNYSVTDSNGNTTEAVRKVNVVTENFDEPIIDIDGPNAFTSGNPLTLEVGDTFNNFPVSATDATDGNRSVGVEIIPDGLVNGQIAQVEGTFSVVYTASDTTENETTEIRTVVVVGKDPVIEIDGDNPATVDVGSAYIDAGATASDVSDGDLTDQIEAVSDLDTMTPGTYFVQYQVTDSRGNTTTEFRQVNVVKSLDYGQTSNVFWLPSGVPNFRLSGGIGTGGGQVTMYDIFENGEAGADINFLSTSQNRRRAGYILASLWMQYYLGLGTEFKDIGSDIAVRNSLLADPFSPALAPDGAGLNLSATLDGVATAGQFDIFEDTRATSQFRLQGASAWATIARSYDPKSARLIAKRPRTFYPELAAAAPVGTAAPVTNLSSVPTGSFLGTKYLKGERSFFRIASENTLPVVRGQRKRAADPCIPGRLIDIPTSSPIVFEFPVDSNLLELSVSISEPCTSDLINLDSILIDPLGRRVDPEFLSNDSTQRIYIKNPSVAGKWRLELSARSFTAEGVKIDVTASSFEHKHRISADLVHKPSNLATRVVTYPDPIVLEVSDTAGQATRGATVKGNLRLPTGTEIPVTFSDNGVSPDLIANDGSYSTDLRYPQNGIYHLEVSIADLAGTASLTYTGTSRAPSLGLDGIVSTPAPADVPVGEPYMRTLFLDFTVQDLATDDHGNTAAEFTSLLLTNADKSGRIDTSTDVDYFRIQVRSRAAVDTVARLTNASGGGQYLLRMFDSTGIREIARGSNGPSGYPQIHDDLEPGAYFLAVSASGAKVGDTYSVSAGPPIPSDLAAIGIDVISGGSRGGGGGGGGGGCFIATAAYGTPLQAEIDRIRGLRDERLLTNAFGAAFTDAYYRLSPPIANAVAQNGALRVGVRGGIEAVLALMNLDARAVLALGAIAALILAAGARKIGKTRA